MFHYLFDNNIQRFFYGLLALVLIVATITDLRQRRIPNLLTYPTIILALSLHSLTNGWNGALFSLGGLAFGFFLFFLPYCMGGIGAGDVKLMSGVGAVLGFQQTAVCFLFIALCGGLMALGFMVYRRNVRATFTKTFLAFLYLSLHRDASLLKVDKGKITQEGIPYGAAITGGFLLFLLYMIMNNTLPA